MKTGELINKARELIAKKPGINIVALIDYIHRVTGEDKDNIHNKLVKGAKAPKVKLETIDLVSRLIAEEPDAKGPQAAVAVAHRGPKWLLGKSTACDERSSKWCFPGGMIKKGETPEEAACREAYEEMGVKCQPIKEIARDSHGDVVFILCKIIGGKLQNNHEFSDVGIFDISEIEDMNTYNTINIIEQI